MENKCQEKGFLWHFMSMIYIENDVANVLKAADLMYICELETEYRGGRAVKYFTLWLALSS